MVAIGQVLSAEECSRTCTAPFPLCRGKSSECRVSYLGREQSCVSEEPGGQINGTKGRSGGLFWFSPKVARKLGN